MTFQEYVSREYKAGGERRLLLVESLHKSINTVRKWATNKKDLTPTSYQIAFSMYQHLQRVEAAKTTEAIPSTELPADVIEYVHKTGERLASEAKHRKGASLAPIHDGYNLEFRRAFGTRKELIEFMSDNHFPVDYSHIVRNKSSMLQYELHVEDKPRKPPKTNDKKSSKK